MGSEEKKSFGGRGTGLNPTNRFERNSYSTDFNDGVDEPIEDVQKTRFLEIHPKTIVNKVTSPDVGMDYSLNPYQGCEHGCTYCYARPTHEYWGYSAGLDFEQTILVKKNAPELLRETLNHKNWAVKPIVLSGNTDCYQPAERKFGVTRKLLEVFLEYKHPVGIISKNSLMFRDLDLIEALAADRLISVYLSITTLDEKLRRTMEPRTATTKKKLELVRALSDLEVPVTVMAAPIIPGLNDHEILSIAQAASEAGAKGFHAHVVRLMGPNAQLFEHWLSEHYSDRATKVMNQIREIHGGKTGSSEFGKRNRGQGAFAVNIRMQRELAKRLYFSKPADFSLRTDLFRRPDDIQMRLF